MISEKKFVEMGFKSHEYERLVGKGLSHEEAIAKLDGFYLLFPYTTIGVEKELEQYAWHMTRLSTRFWNTVLPIALDKLMRFAVRKG